MITASAIKVPGQLEKAMNNEILIHNATMISPALS
jgi:hypothetical protein